ncbi:hypothetical protein BIW11_04150 [Tropilaelaps mercedesae]|uniref:Uncharacterized protein n=1 Tax=Tropilaelaps mercedesae TaxID=418985 RepID=A0A1V9XAW1_9ACAR|nr:hypothetical protein BIW11_04150 [Tropilaelaps mercedesae]
MRSPTIAWLPLGLALFTLKTSATVLVTGKYTDNTCIIRGDWRYIKQIDETITEVFPEISNRDSFSLVDIRKSPVEVLDLLIRYNYNVATSNTVGPDTLWTLQKRR